MSPEQALLDVRDLSCAAGGVSILSGVSLSLMRGEILSIIGPNGAGKSTLARCIAGIAKPRGGGVFLEGRPVAAIPPRERARLVCAVPQTQGDAPPFTVRDFVAMGRYAYRSFRGAARRDDDRRVDEALALVGAGDFADRRLPALSGGERQLAAIAAGLAQEAKLLVLDEPATYLDPARRDAFLHLILRINRERGISLCIVTHDVNMAMRFTHRVVALREGRVVHAGAGAGLADRAVLEAIYGAGFSLLPLPGTLPLAVSETYAL